MQAAAVERRSVFGHLQGVQALRRTLVMRDAL